MVDNCVVCLFFDGETEEHLRYLWRALAMGSVSQEMPEAGWRPHITLSGCNQLDLSGYMTALQEVASETPALTVMLSSVGFFASDRSTLFLAPAMTQPLLDFHQHHNVVAARFALQMSPHYLPNFWVPHTTLALNLSPESLLRAVEIIRTESCLPVVGSLSEIGIVQVARPKVHSFCTFRMGI